LSTFEQGFVEMEKAADATIRAAKALISNATLLVRVANDGDVSRMRKIVDHLDLSLSTLTQEVANVRGAWPFSAGEEEQYLRERYGVELLQQAKLQGVQISKWDEALVAYPSLLRIIPSERAVKVDRTKTQNLRPSKIVGLLKRTQTTKTRMRSETFLEVLYQAYCLIVGNTETGTTVLLAQIYKVLTILPMLGHEYDKSEFARDLLMLDRSGVRTTKTGLSFSLPAATGTKGSKDIFTSVGPDGVIVTFYAINFSKDAL
jgi:hypothetical protein